MHPAKLLDLASTLLQTVLKFEAPTDAVVAAFFRQHRGMGSRERALLAETIYRVVRRRLLYVHLAQSGQGAVERRLALLAWSGTQEALAVAASAPEYHWRMQALAQQDALPPTDALRHNLPNWLATALQAELGGQFWPWVDALEAPTTLDLRVNLLKVKREEVIEVLNKADISAQATRYSPWGIRIQGKPVLERLGIVAEGWVEVQDEGSQLLALLTGARRGETIADYCAGAGGKTLALGAMMRNTGRLYAFDTSGHRLAALKPRLVRSSVSNVHPMQLAHEADARLQRLQGKMDRVLVDAPCSGLGTLRRSPDLKWRQTPNAIRELTQKQALILRQAARLLKPGGRLIYATCSVLTAENEAVVQAVMAEQPQGWRQVDALEVLKAARVYEPESLVSNACLRLWPHVHQTDGFFAAIWEKVAPGSA